MNYYDTHDMKIELEICDMSSSFSSHIEDIQVFQSGQYCAIYSTIEDI